MTLIKSISGIRGTIGGKPGTNLTPVDIVECTAGYGLWIKKRSTAPKVIVGRDGRITGKIVSELAINTLLSMGIHVVDLDLSTTPTVEIAVAQEKASGGIIFTASHNPKQWNALKFLNDRGEFISANDGEEILNYITEGKLDFVEVDDIGTLTTDNTYIDTHIKMILDLPYVNQEAIRSKGFSVIVDCINSTGAISVPPLLEKLGCTIHLINEEITGEFAHNPEPRPEHLVDLSNKVVELKADLGISVDPDVDRLAFVSEDGSIFGEEYTLVAVADSILTKKKGNTVSNLSSTRALADITKKHGSEYTAAAVGEVNVVTAMKKTNAIIGGEGNGGVILPDLHYGRDALAGIALMLDLLAESNKSMSELKKGYPEYTIVKDKIELTPEMDVNHLLNEMAKVYKNEELNTLDGLKIDFAEGWIHMRKSNTEPIIRVYSEASTAEQATRLADGIKAEIDKILK